MQNLNYIKDDKGRIIKVVSVNGVDSFAKINWTNDNLDIDFCNLVIMIACSTRGVGDTNG